MISIKTYLLVILFLSSNLCLASFAVGNGGDLVQCRPLAGSTLSGNYSLDYLITLNISNNYKVQPTVNLKQSLERIYKTLANKAPLLVRNFQEFIRNYKNTTNYSIK